MEEVSGLGNVDHVVYDLGEFFLFVFADHCVATETKSW